MAFCGTALSDEKKDVDSDDEHSLDNIIVFSTKRQEMCGPSAEELLTKDDNGNLIDRRTKICYDDEKYFSNSYGTITQVTAKFHKGKGVGSASYTPFVNGVILFITCAHNLVSWSSLRKMGVPVKDVKVYGRRDGKEKWLFWSKNIERKIVHPEYNGKPDCGYDLGIIIPSKLPDFGVWAKFSPKETFPKYQCKMDSYLTDPGVNPKDIIKGMTLELMGYPGEKKGYPYTHRGEVLSVHQTDLGGWVIYYDVDATPGNSGSPIYLTDEKYIKKLSNRAISKLMIGVHTGHDDVVNCNFGTLLTEPLVSWFTKEVEHYLKK